MSIFDWLGSLLFAVVIGIYILRLPNLITWTIWVVWWIFFGIVVHYILGINTMLGYYVGLNPPPRRTECPSKL